MGKKLLSLFLVLLMFGMIEQNEMVIKATTSFLIQDVKNTTTEDLGNGYIYETNTQKDVKGVKAYSTTTTYTKTHKIINSSTGELVLLIKWMRFLKMQN